jgi:hypothetical protein
LIVARGGFVAKLNILKGNQHKKRFIILDVLKSLLHKNTMKTM